MPSSVRVRFAPSPTGSLHLGSARTAIYNWAFARNQGGTFVLRIDDTDPERSTAENTEEILRAMRWLGLDWDEGPEVGGEYGPYFQTQRAATYAPALEKMREHGATYPCFCTAEELERAREEARARGDFVGYARTCRCLSAEEAADRIAAGEPHVWRLRVPEGRGEIVVVDVIRGETAFPADAMDDFVLVRSDGTPTYNFATVVDDHLMEITHVIRGEDHLPNTPRQILVFEALGAPVPRFAHMSLIFGPDGKKLSKRHGATSVEAYRDLGYLPEAVLNFLAILGWSIDGKTTIVPPEMLKKEFKLERIGKNPAIFDAEKLEWMNGVYIRELSPDELVDLMVPWLVSAGLADESDAQARREWYLKLAPLVSERIKRLDEIVPMVRFLFEEPEIDEGAKHKVLGKEGAGTALGVAAEVLGSCEWTAEKIEEALRAVPERTGLKPKVVFQAVRVAVTGTAVSPPLFESLELLERERVLARVDAALAVSAP